MQSNKPRSLSKQRIIDAAFENFVANGYEGASLNTIAEMVGIRKASIYAHFSSKDELFLMLLDDALTLECDFVCRSFQDTDPLHFPGEAYCLAYKSRFENEITSRFLTRIGYVPPSHLVEVIANSYKVYTNVIYGEIQRSLQVYDLTVEQIEIYTDAYLGVVDSLSIELLYAAPMYDRRLKAMLMMFKSFILHNQNK